MVSALILNLSPGQNIVLCSWVRHSILSVLLSTQLFKEMCANLMLVVTLLFTSILSRGGGGVEMLLAASRHRQWDKLWHGGPLFVFFLWWATLLVCRLYLVKE